MINISINKRHVIPGRRVWTEMIFVGFLTVFLQFVLNIFGLQSLLDFVPDGWEIVVLVAVSVYIKNALKITLGRTEFI